MDTVCHGLQFAFVYTDDILIASKDVKTYKAHPNCCFSGYGLVIDVAKCPFGWSSLDFLGHLITDTGIVPLPDKVEAVIDM